MDSAMLIIQFFFPADERRRPLTGAKLYYFVTGRQVVMRTRSPMTCPQSSSREFRVENANANCTQDSQ